MSEFVFKLPDLGEGTVEAEIVEWRVQPGQQVNEEDPIVDLMTDKATVEVPAPVSGRVVSVSGGPGDMVAVGSPLIVFETNGAGAALPALAPAGEPARPAPAAAQVAAAPAANSLTSGGKVVTSPAIRRQAREAGIDLGKIVGSGPRGRIVREDLEVFLRNGGSAPVLRQRETAVEEIKIIGLRRLIAERMAAAKREIPHFAYVEEIDVTELEALRVHLNGLGDPARPKLTILPFLGMALIRALREFPQCNALHDAERNLIARHRAVHLGVATQTPDGLKVPVVRHAESLGLTRLAVEVQRVTAAARDNSAKREELSGSTITITSLGKLGGIASTPVINAPEVAIIGVNRAVERPVLFEGQVTVRRMMNLSSSFDHRFVDGYDAAAMIQVVKGLLEHPATIFIDD